jgi:hypothetical protein
MSVTARYQPGAVRTPFVDREDVLAAFAEEMSRLGERPCLLELSGVGGIGKSRLSHELRRRVPDDIATALLNLQEPAQRSALAALGTLRAQFGQCRIKFDRFDIAYAVWWQSLTHRGWAQHVWPARLGASGQEAARGGGGTPPRRHSAMRSPFG